MNKTVELVASADNKSEYINVRDKIDENTNELVLRIPLGSIESRINWAQSHEYMVTKPDKAKNRSGGNLTMYQWSKNIAGITFKMSGYIPYKDGVDSW